MSKNVVYIAMGLAVSLAAAIMDATLKTDKHRDVSFNGEFQSTLSVTPNPKLYFRPGTGIGVKPVY